MSKVSIIVPCYKQAQFLSETLGSILAQSHTDWECIVINDGSPDNTGELVRHWMKKDARIKYVEQDNRGLSAARNAGVKVASGRYLQFLDADDLLEVHKLRNHVAYLDANQDIDIVYGDARYFPDGDSLARKFGINANVAYPWIPTLWYEHGTLLEKFLQRNLLPVNAAMVRAALFARVGYWNETLQALEDWEFWTRCAGLGLRFQYFEGPQSLALIRMHPTSMTRDSSRMEHAYLEMLVVLGEAVPNMILRGANFRRGSRLGANFTPPAFRRYIIRLARANWTISVGFSALVVLASSVANGIGLMCLRAYRKTVPWPLQKAVISLSRRNSK